MVLLHALVSILPQFRLDFNASGRRPGRHSSKSGRRSPTSPLNIRHFGAFVTHLARGTVTSPIWIITGRRCPASPAKDGKTRPKWSLSARRYDNHVRLPPAVWQRREYALSCWPDTVLLGHLPKSRKVRKKGLTNVVRCAKWLFLVGLIQILPV